MNNREGLIGVVRLSFVFWDEGDTRGIQSCLLLYGKLTTIDFDTDGE
jgi:hypothetical protein